jgi:hypothetical protein
MYISHRKAKQLHKWHQVDTSDFKIKFNHQINFRKWTQPRIEWMTDLKNILNSNKLNYVHFDYDEIHQSPDLTSDSEKLKYILQYVNHCQTKNQPQPTQPTHTTQPHFLIDLLDSTQIIKSKIIRQDQTTNYQNKVSNFFEMIDYLKQTRINVNHLRELFK